MQKETQEQLANSLTAQTTELLPFLPYLLQDFWALGINPGMVTELVRRHVGTAGNTRILDLACGKGAVSVKLAQTLGVRAKGIDLIPEFVDYAAQKARELGVDALCEFAVGDANQAVKAETDYDCVVFGAIGDVLGGRLETLNKLKQTVKPGGYVLLDNYDFIDRAQWTALFREAGLVLVEAARDDEWAGSDDAAFRLVADSDLGMAAITRRANELIRRHPDKKSMFEGYVSAQQQEYEEIGNSNSGDNVTWLLKKADGQAH